MSGILKGKGSLQVTTLNLLAYRIAFLFKDLILIYLSIFVCCLHSLIYIVSKWWFMFSLCESFANLVMFKTINSSECIGVKEFLSLDLCSVHWHLLPLKDMPCGLTHTPNFSTCSFLSCLYWHPELLAEGKEPVVKTELHLILDLHPEIMLAEVSLFYLTIEPTLQVAFAILFKGWLGQCCWYAYSFLHTNL